MHPRALSASRSSAIDTISELLSLVQIERRDMSEASQTFYEHHSEPLSALLDRYDSSFEWSCDIEETALPTVNDVLRQLVTLYVENEVSPNDPPLAFTLSDAQESDYKRLLHFLLSNNAQDCNAWNLGSLLASVLLAGAPKGCGTSSLLQVEQEIELYLILLLAITSAQPIADLLLNSLAERTSAGVDDTDDLIRRARKVVKARPASTMPTFATCLSKPELSICTDSTGSSSPCTSSSSTPFSSPRSRPRPERSMSDSSVFSSPTSKLAHDLLKSPATSPIISEKQVTGGSFVPTAPAATTLERMAPKRSQSMSQKPETWRGRMPRWLSPSYYSRSSFSSSSSSDTSSRDSVPSISRTPSLDSDYTPPSSPVNLSLPTSKSKRRSLSPTKQESSLSPFPVSEAESALHASLKRVEDGSKFRIRSECAACGKSGSNFPKCPRCNVTWCSRDCRVQSNGGKRHVCARANSC